MNADSDVMVAEIIAIEDEAPIRDLVTTALSRHGFSVRAVENTGEARTALADRKFDLALIDWMLPGGSGLELVRELRKDDLYKTMPIIMLTARSSEQDITNGLDAGADDYMTKPFSPRELHSRVKALLRRSRSFEQNGELTLGNLTLDTASHRVKVDGHEIKLGHTEFKLLTFLMQHPERVYSRSQLLDHVWGPGTFIEERTVDVHILRLRKSLKPHGADTYLETVRGAGYRLAA